MMQLWLKEKRKKIIFKEKKILCPQKKKKPHSMKREGAPFVSMKTLLSDCDFLD